MRITSTEELGMRLMLQLAARYPRTVAVTELAADEGLAEPFAAKVVAQLKRAGLVVASRGRSGGYAMAGAPEQVTVLQVFHALGERLFDVAFCERHAGEPDNGCRREADCALRSVWAHLDATVAELLDGVTLSHLLAGEPSTHDRLLGQRPTAGRLPALDVQGERTQ